MWMKPLFDYSESAFGESEVKELSEKKPRTPPLPRSRQRQMAAIESMAEKVHHSAGIGCPAIFTE